MIKTIRKRDGRETAFDISKIADAIHKAGIEKFSAEKIAGRVLNYLNTKYDGSFSKPGVESIQDAVEKELITSGYVEIAKKYILYRAERTRIREMNTRLMKTFEDLHTKDAKDNELKRENANIDGDTAMGHMLKYGSESAKQFNELFILHPDHAAAHKNGDIHIHDLDFLTLTTTCCQIDIAKLFKGGFGTGHGSIREPNDIRSYSSLACIAIQSNQNDQHGGQSIPNFDYGLAPGVAKTYVKMYRQNLAKAIELTIRNDVNKVISLLKEFWETSDVPKISDTERSSEVFKAERNLLKFYIGEMKFAELQAFAVKKAVEETEKATYQAMEALVHNLNTMHSRAGAQIPFSSINYGMDTSAEGRMVILNILLATDAGLGDGETPIFPIQIFRVKEGVNYNKEDPNYDLLQLACKVSGKRLFPNFSFQDAPFNLQYYKSGHPETEISYMGCRTRVIGNVHDKDREITFGRGNLSFTSVNLPRIALNSNKDIDVFFKELDKKANLVINQLLERFEIQARKKVKNFPFLMGQGIWIDSDKLEWEDEIREIIKHGTLSIGFIGLAECLKALIGKHHGESMEAQELGLKIIGRLRTLMDEASVKHKLNFSLIATPAEGLSGRFVGIDRKIFGNIPGITDREYYTNGFHVPVYYNIGAYDKIKIEAPYHALTNAGHITYVELDGDVSKNPEAFEKIVRVMKEAGIGYGSINHPLDRDSICGYRGIINDVCPKCGRTEGSIPFERIRRITGYLVGTLERFNNAKHAEEHDRVKHKV